MCICGFRVVGCVLIVGGDFSVQVSRVIWFLFFDKHVSMCIFRIWFTCTCFDCMMICKNRGGKNFIF